MDILRTAIEEGKLCIAPVFYSSWPLQPAANTGTGDWWEGQEDSL